MHLYVRELNIHVDIVNIRRGTALEELLHKPFGSLTFPKIHLLSVMLLPLTMRHHLADQLAGPQTVKSNIQEFVRHVKHIVPLMNKVCVRLASCPAHSPKFADHHVGSLVWQLCQLSDDVEHSLYYEVLPIEMQPTGITKLLFYNQNMSGGSSNILVMQLVHRNMASL
ncbi:hypothetical protein GGF42_005942 [Coemansia sp. RSA 2424]|nr:hypothetical protein GGF42_005942 [Coemansia sp. RSA 2424]